MIKYFFYIICFLCCFSAALAQDVKPPFYEDIEAFKKQDSLAFPAKKQILFIGSSSFTIWKDVQEYFPAHKILNKAFGGSTLLDVIYYRYQVIYPFEPAQIVLYCGENDFAYSDTVSVETVTARFKTLYNLIRARFPTVPFTYVSMKPSPSRKYLMPKFSAANAAIKQWLLTKKHTSFADVYSQMLTADGQPMSDIFLNDELHMNKMGYAIWQKIIEPYLVK